MRTDGQTDERKDMIKLRVAFRNFANGPTIKWTLYREIISVCYDKEELFSLHNINRFIYLTLFMHSVI